MKNDIRGARASLVTRNYPEIEACFRKDIAFHALPFEYIDLIEFLRKVFNYTQPESQKYAGISKTGSFYYYLKHEYEKLPF